MPARHKLTSIRHNLVNTGLTTVEGEDTGGPIEILVTNDQPISSGFRGADPHIADTFYMEFSVDQGDPGSPGYQSGDGNELVAQPYGELIKIGYSLDGVGSISNLRPDLRGLITIDINGWLQSRGYPKIISPDQIISAEFLLQYIHRQGYAHGAGFRKPPLSLVLKHCIDEPDATKIPYIDWWDEGGAGNDAWGVSGGDMNADYGVIPQYFNGFAEYRGPDPHGDNHTDFQTGNPTGLVMRWDVKKAISDVASTDGKFSVIMYSQQAEDQDYDGDGTGNDVVVEYNENQNKNTDVIKGFSDLYAKSTSTYQTNESSGQNNYESYIEVTDNRSVNIGVGYGLPSWRHLGPTIKLKYRRFARNSN